MRKEKYYERGTYCILLLALSAGGVCDREVFDSLHRRFAVRNSIISYSFQLVENIVNQAPNTSHIGEWR